MTTPPQDKDPRQTLAGRINEARFQAAIKLANVYEECGGTASSLNWLPDAGRRMCALLARIPPADVETWEIVETILRRCEFAAEADAFKAVAS